MQEPNFITLEPIIPSMVITQPGINPYTQQIDIMQIHTEVMNCVIQPLNGRGGLYLGSIEAAVNLPLLKACNVKGVLTMCEEAQIDYPKDMMHAIIQCHDVETVDLTLYFMEAHAFINNARLRGNVLVHCIVGVSRSATMVVSYLMQKWNMLLEEALRHVITTRPIINPNVGFVQQLLDYEMQLYGSVQSILTPEISYHYRVQQNPKYIPHPKKDDSLTPEKLRQLVKEQQTTSDPSISTSKSRKSIQSRLELKFTNTYCFTTPQETRRLSKHVEFKKINISGLPINHQLLLKDKN